MRPIPLDDPRPPASARRAPSGIRACLVPVLALACSSDLPELRPGIFDSPTSVETHGRITQKAYRRSNGPRTIHYLMLEVDGSRVRVENGFAQRAAYCPTAGIDAAAVQVRGPAGAAGIYKLQAIGDEVHFEKICEYSMSLGTWSGSVFTGCDPPWDASKPPAG